MSPFRGWKEMVTKSMGLTNWTVDNLWPASRCDVVRLVFQGSTLAFRIETTISVHLL